MARPRKISDEAIRVARELMARRMPKATIKTVLDKTFQLGPRSCETVFARVREEINREFDRPKEQHQADSMSFYESVIRDPKASNRDKIRAQEGIDRLLGLSAQFTQRVELSGPDGQPVEIAKTSTVLILPTLEDDDEEPKNGNGHHNGSNGSAPKDQAATRATMGLPPHVG